MMDPVKLTPLLLPEQIRRQSTRETVVQLVLTVMFAGYAAWAFVSCAMSVRVVH